MAVNWVREYQSIPFVDGGRGHDGCDCWGLIRLVYLEQLGIELPSYGEISAYQVNKKAEAFLAGSAVTDWWLPIDGDPQSFDVVVMRAHGHREVGHCGLVLPDGRILHTEEKTGPVIVGPDNFTVKNRIKFYRRHKTQCS